MKKQYLFFLALIFLACTPQVTVTSEVTVTSTPTSTATETPAPPTQTATLTVETRILNGVTFTLGEVNDDGSVKVTGMRVDGNYTDEQKAEKLIAVNPLAWGFETSEVELVFVGDYLQIVATGDRSQVLAEWNYGRNEYVWYWSVMEVFEGGNPFFDLAKATKMNGGTPVDRVVAGEDSYSLIVYAGNYYALKPTSGYKGIFPIYIDNPSGSESIIAYLLTKSNSVLNNPELAASGDMNATVCFIDKETGTMRNMFIQGLKYKIRYWN